jgi:hypothetical protein
LERIPFSWGGFSIMGSKKKTTTQSNTFAYQPGAQSADIDALRGLKAKADTSIPYQYARMRERQDNSYANPLGAYTSPAVRDAVSRNAGQGLAMDEAQAVRSSQQNADNINYGRQAGIAGMTAPQLVQTGGTQVQKTPKDWASLIMGGAQTGMQLGTMAGL